MKRLRWIAIVSTTITALLLFVGANTGLALPPVAPNGVRPLVFRCLNFHSLTTRLSCRFGCGRFFLLCSFSLFSWQPQVGLWFFSGGEP